MTTIKKLDNLLDNQDKQVIATKFTYDNLWEVFETTLYAPVTTSKGLIEVPLRIYPTERQRGILGLIESLLEVSNQAQVDTPLEDRDYIDLIFTIENPELDYRRKKAPRGLLETIAIKWQVTTDDGDPTSLEVDLSFTTKNVIGAHSLFMGKTLRNSELAQYLYDTLVGSYDRVPKFIRATSKSLEFRLYPDNDMSKVTLIGNNLVIRGKGDETIALDMTKLTGNVKVTHNGYIIVLTSKKEKEEVVIYV